MAAPPPRRARRQEPPDDHMVQIGFPMSVKDLPADHMQKWKDIGAEEGVRFSIRAGRHCMWNSDPPKCSKSCPNVLTVKSLAPGLDGDDEDDD